MKNYRSMNANQMSAELREMAELAPTPDLQECYQHAAALLGVAQGAPEPVGWQFLAVDGKWRWIGTEKPEDREFQIYPERIRPLYTSPVTEERRG